MHAHCGQLQERKEFVVYIYFFVDILSRDHSPKKILLIWKETLTFKENARRCKFVKFISIATFLDNNYCNSKVYFITVGEIARYAKESVRNTSY